MSIFDFSSNNKCLVIAESCDNHMGCMDTALEMCNQAKLSGADIIKFQHHLADEEMLEDSPMSDNFDKSTAFKAACELVFHGKTQPSGYTEPILHLNRLLKKN